MKIRDILSKNNIDIDILNNIFCSVNIKYSPEDSLSDKDYLLLSHLFHNKRIAEYVELLKRERTIKSQLKHIIVVSFKSTLLRNCPPLSEEEKKRREEEGKRIEEEIRQEEYDAAFDDNDSDRDSDLYDDVPNISQMIHTHGKMFPCPTCGSNDVKTFADGTAKCNNCKEWYYYG
jgi:hypothetical protein